MCPGYEAESTVSPGGPALSSPADVVAGGSVTVMVFAAEVTVSPLVLFDAVTVNVFTGCPFPGKLEFRVRPLMLCPTGALIVNVNVPPARPCTNWLVTVSPLGVVIDSKAGTPLIVTESLSSESTGDAVIPICVEPARRYSQRGGRHQRRGFGHRIRVGCCEEPMRHSAAVDVSSGNLSCIVNAKYAGPGATKRIVDSGETPATVEKAVGDVVAV